MKRTIAIPVLALVLGLASAAFGDTTAGTVKIAFIAYQNPNQLMEDIDPVVEYLERAMKLRIKPFVSTDYAGIVEALNNGSADIGFMGPLQYVIANRRAGAQAILGEIYQGKPTYRSHIFVRKDSGIESLSDLKGKSIAFVDPISSSGYLYPLTIFKDAGLIKGAPEDFFKRVYFAGGDEQAIRAVYNDFVDAAAVGQFSFSLLRFEERDEVKVIGESRPIPSHCVVVRKGLDESIVKRFKSALLALNAEGPDHALLQKLYNVDGYVEVDNSTYAGVEEIAIEYGFIKR